MRRCRRRCELVNDHKAADRGRREQAPCRFGAPRVRKVEHNPERGGNHPYDHRERGRRERTRLEAATRRRHRDNERDRAVERERGETLSPGAGHTLATAEARPHGEAVSDHGCRSRQIREVGATQLAADDAGQRRLAHVDEQYDRSPLRPEHAERVQGAGVARAGFANVDLAPGGYPCDDHRGRNRAEQIRDHERCDNVHFWDRNKAVYREAPSEQVPIV